MTQKAIWYFTDDTKIDFPETKLTANERMVYDKLINTSADNKENLVTAAVISQVGANINLYLAEDSAYEGDGKAYQSLLTVQTDKQPLPDTDKTKATLTLTLEKEVEGDVVAGKAFDFTIALKNKKGEPLTEAVVGDETKTLTDGLLKVSVVVDESGKGSTKISGLPDGYSYTIIEDEYYDYYPTITSSTERTAINNDDRKASQTYVTTNVNVKYVNKHPDTVSLTIKKDVDGYAKEGSLFHFGVSLKDKYGNPISGTYEVDGTDRIISNGLIDFYLSDGQSTTISGLPVGYSYSIIEDKYKDFNVEISSTSTGTVKFETNK